LPNPRLLKGTPGRRPSRPPPEAARADQCPEPPNQLNAYAKEVWLELAPELYRLNLLTVLDVRPEAVHDGKPVPMALTLT